MLAPTRLMPRHARHVAGVARYGDTVGLATLSCHRGIPRPFIQSASTLHTQLLSGHRISSCGSFGVRHYGSTLDDPLDFFVLDAANFDEVYAFVRTHFLPREPLTVGAGCPGSIDLTDMVWKDVCSGVSMGVRDGATGALVGVRLSSVLSSKPTPEPLPEDLPPDALKVVRMLDHLWEAVDVFADEGVERIMKSDILNTHSDYNGRGLAKRLVESTEKLGAARGCQLLYTQPTNVISAAIFSRRGYDTRYTLRLDTVKDEDGSLVFDTSVMFGNEVVSVMSKRVNSEEKVVIYRDEV